MLENKVRIENKMPPTKNTHIAGTKNNALWILFTKKPLLKKVLRFIEDICGRKKRGSKDRKMVRKSICNQLAEDILGEFQDGWPEDVYRGYEMPDVWHANLKRPFCNSIGSSPCIIISKKTGKIINYVEVGE